MASCMRIVATESFASRSAVSGSLVIAELTVRVGAINQDVFFGAGERLPLHAFDVQLQQVKAGVERGLPHQRATALGPRQVAARTLGTERQRKGLAS